MVHSNDICKKVNSKHSERSKVTSEKNSSSHEDTPPRGHTQLVASPSSVAVFEKLYLFTEMFPT